MVMLLLLLVVLLLEVVVRVTEGLADRDRARCEGVILYLQTHEVGFM